MKLFLNNGLINWREKSIVQDQFEARVKIMPEAKHRFISLFEFNFDLLLLLCFLYFFCFRLFI